MVVGLYTDPSRPDPTAGVVFRRPASDPTGELEAAVRAEIARLEEKARTVGLTAAEIARLNQLRAGLQGNTALTLGLPGGGTFADARAQVVGRNGVIAVGGETETRRAPISGVLPRTQAGWAAFRAAYRQQANQAQEDVQRLEARIAAIEGGSPDPGPGIGSSSISQVPSVGGRR